VLLVESDQFMKTWGSSLFIPKQSSRNDTAVLVKTVHEVSSQRDLNVLELIQHAQLTFALAVAYNSILHIIILLSVNSWCYYY
jgi:hypothetical protein